MQRIWKIGSGLALLAAVLSLRTAFAGDDGPYAPLKLYDGSWEVKVSVPESKTDHLVNHCAQTGLFYACEQVVNGKTGALVVFLPVGKTASGAQEYRTQPLLANASAAGDWGHLTIDGDNWLYSWDSRDGKKTVHWRVTNHFTGKDKIHFEVQNSEDGTNWKTQSVGDEERKN
ncbi:MAG TPA: hypothetical protein VKH45_14705 [Candidatus Acidoferrum sp.]|nr:hypothetical protein [Candidatus Acidoferrum sp.]